MTKTTRFNLAYAVFAVMGVFLLHDLWVSYQTVTPLAYSEFQKLLQEGKIKEIVVTEGEIRGELENPEPPNKKYFRTTRVDGALAAELQKHEGVDEAKAELKETVDFLLGHVALETEQRSLLGPTAEALPQRLYGDDTAREIDCAVRKTVLAAFERATGVLAENRALLEQSARLLLQKETLDTPDLERLFAGMKPTPAHSNASGAAQALAAASQG
jgi:ATP-dependent Zn protease